jgi:hypothetical protein
MLDPSVLTDHEFNGLNHGSGRIGPLPRVRRIWPVRVFLQLYVDVRLLTILLNLSLLIYKTFLNYYFAIRHQLCVTVYHFKQLSRLPIWKLYCMAFPQLESFVINGTTTASTNKKKRPFLLIHFYLRLIIHKLACCWVKYFCRPIPLISKCN